MSLTPREYHLKYTLLETFLFLGLFLIFSQMTSALCSPYMNQGQVRYWELQRMNASCYPKDSCRIKRSPEEDNLGNYNCLCGRSCVELNACCVDSPFRLHRPTTQLTHSCVQIHGQINTFFMVDKCSKHWSGDPYIAGLCKGKAEDLNDPMLLIPVTNSKSLITYTNYFCAACNADSDLQHISFWPITLTSFQNNISQTEIANLKYSSEHAAWILPGKGGNDDIADIITIQLQIPTGGHVKTCMSDVISSCASDWSDDVTKRKCASYMAMVALPDEEKGKIVYRNIHCVICNKLKFDNRQCEIRKAGGYGAAWAPVSFALLLDVNRSDGDIVGQVQLCPDKQLYDPFSKKCRVIKCPLPGYVIKNTGCVRRS